MLAGKPMLKSALYVNVIFEPCPGPGLIRVFFEGTGNLFICFDKWTPDQGIHKKIGPPPPHVLYFLITSTSVFPEGGQTMFVGRKTHNAGLLQHW